nr:O-antigen ligase family protein [methane-oxidizing endosymbiont of Gigantopelta aegis]
MDTSTSVRFSMWKIAWQLFLHNPIFGYGDQGYTVFLDKPWFSSTASGFAKKTMACCGPHNELLANMLRSGILGGLSVLCLFFIPLVLFFRNAFDSNTRISEASRLGISYIITVMICSISIEVFNLKYTSTFYGLTIAGLFAQIFSEKIKASETGKINY